MKKILLALLLTACAPMASQSSVEPLLFGKDDSTHIWLNAGGQGCTQFFYENASQDGSPSELVYVGINDKFDLKPQKVNGLTFKAEADGDVVQICATADISIKPNTTYSTQVELFHNGVHAVGALEVEVGYSNDIKIDLAEGSYVPLGGQLCVEVLQYKPDEWAEYLPVPFKKINLKMSSKSKLTMSVKNTQKPLCFSAPANMLPGRYEVEVYGLVNGIGVKQPLELWVKK